MRFAAMPLIMLALAATGCVSKADYDQVQVMNRTLAAEKESIAQENLDLASQVDALRGQVRTRESELGVKDELITSLKQENGRLAEMVSKANALVDKVNFNPPKPLVIDRTLPAELDTALKNFATQHGDAVEYDPTRGAIKWKSDLLFASGSDVVKDTAKSTLEGFASIVNTTPAQTFDILIVGHTDSDPIKHSATRHRTNWHLSTHRSISVAEQLLGSSVSAGRIGVMGHGEHRPVATNGTDEGKATNRRVEILLVAQGQTMVPTDGGGKVNTAQSAPPAAEPDK